MPLELWMSYVSEATDLSGVLEAVREAIRVLKESKKPSLAQLQSLSQTVRRVVGLADALGVMDAKIQRTTAMFVQGDPSIPMENYKFHSAGGIDTLEDLQNKFRTMKDDVDKTEVSSVADHEAFMQQKTDLVKSKNAALDTTRKQKFETVSATALNSEQLSTAAAELLDDKQYLAELAGICSNKAKTRDKRISVRADELSALTAAITIVKETVAEKTSAASVRLAQQGVSVRMAEAMAEDEDVLEADEAAAEEADKSRVKAVSFLQRVARHQPTPSDLEAGRQSVIKILDSKGQLMKSSLLLSLASQIAADPLAKVKELIQALIERLLHEAASEGNQKGFCDKAQADAKGKQARNAEKIETLNARLAQNEAVRDKLAIEIDTLGEEIAEMEAKQKEATAMREEEKAENAATIEEAGLLVFVNLLSELLGSAELARHGWGEPGAGEDLGKSLHSQCLVCVCLCDLF